MVSGQHRQLGRRVAIKQLPAAFASDPSARRRFTAEAQVLASLDHPHVVPVYDFVESGGLCLLVMELLPGGTLRSRVTDAGGITSSHAVAATLACLSGLCAAHRRGVLHRDIKPENMLFAASGVLKVTDFGIAKVADSPGTVLTRGAKSSARRHTSRRSRRAAATVAGDRRLRRGDDAVRTDRRCPPLPRWRRHVTALPARL